MLTKSNREKRSKVALLLERGQCGFLLGRDISKSILMGQCSRSWVVAVWVLLSETKEGN